MNSSKTLSRRTLVIVIIAGFVLSIAFAASYVLKRPLQSDLASLSVNAAAFRQPKQAYVGLPVRLKIPKLNIDAALDYVGITPQGALGVPGGPNDAAWYDQGPRPGQKGDAVIDGHSGWKDNIPAVFDNLHNLQKGDDIYVEDAEGVTTTFVVRAVQTYGRNEADSAVFIPSDGEAHLNLITCEGVWSQAQKSYSNRLVVFADKELV